jgi:acyl-CoA thioester hydrolase
MSLTMSEFPTSTYHYRVYYEHTDSGGVVYHSRYLNFFERARTDWLRDKDISQSHLQRSENIVYAVTAADIKFKKPARMDDTLTVSCQMTKIKNASIEFYQEMYNQDKMLLATVIIKAACLQADTFSVTAFPKHLKDNLKRGMIK